MSGLARGLGRTATLLVEDQTQTSSGWSTSFRATRRPLFMATAVMSLCIGQVLIYSVADLFDHRCGLESTYLDGQQQSATRRDA